MKLIPQNIVRATVLFATIGLSSAGAHAQNQNFTKTPNAAISGHNNRHLSNVSVRDCMDACVAERGFKCVSFDYDKVKQACDLSDTSAGDVVGLKRDYPGNPYDHYAKNEIVERSVLGSGIERSKPARDVLAALQTMNGPDSTHAETSLDNWARRYGVGIKQDDHVQGITMTSTGRIVLSYSRQDQSHERCKGMLAYSTPFDPNNPGKKLTWNYYCDLENGPEGHPSNVQATGEVVIVGTHNGSRFYHVPANGRVQRLSHLDMTSGGRDSSGVVFNHKDGRFYALNASGPITPGQAWTTICRTRANVSLFDQSTRFDDCKSFNTYASGQGSNLIMQEDGTMFLVSAFSTYDEWPHGSWGAYGAACSAETAALAFAGFSQGVDFEDVLVVSTIDWDNKQARLVLNKNISRTQRAQSCVHQRPSFRFSGGVATIGNGELIGLWAGRQNPPVLALGDTFEFSFQKLKKAEPLVSSYLIDIDCDVAGTSNEGTSNVLTVIMRDKDGKEVGRGIHARDTSKPDGTCENIKITVPAVQKASSFTIQTNGSNGALLDRIVVYRNGTQEAAFGADNDSGWCLSTDPLDANGWKGHAFEDVCVVLVPFNL